MIKTITLPFYAKASLICIGLFVFITMLFLAQQIIVPIIYATIFAIVLSPAVDFLVKKKLNHIIAILLTLGLLIAVSIFFFVILSLQMVQFSDTFPILAANFTKLFEQFIAWFSQNSNISSNKIDIWLKGKNTMILEEGTAFIGQTIMSTGGILVVLLLIPVYIFMILLYKSLLISFIHQVFGKGKQGEVSEILSATKGIVQSYLVGIVFEAIIVAVLNCSALLLLGIEYAILLGIIGAIMNIIPYIGNIIAVSLPMLIALATKSPEYTLYVLASYLVIQFIDNNIISPKIVASKVQINALISVIMVVIGGALWGFSGMFLAIPLTAIAKVIFDHIEVMKPLGFLLGDIVPTNSKLPFMKKRK
jgi:predicted PurR-regulated permease PerM